MSDDLPSNAPAGGTVARIRRLAGSFGALHAGNTAFNLVYSLAQLLIFARVLGPDRYADVVFLTSVGFYLQPFDQAVGRANYVSLRNHPPGAPAQRPEAVIALAGQACVLALAAFTTPLVVSHGSPTLYLENLLIVGIALFNSYWAIDLQSTAWGVDRALGFVRIALIQRLGQFVALGVLIVTGSLLMFGVVACAVAIGALTVGLGLLRSQPALSRLRGGGGLGWVRHARLLVSSFLSSLSELVVLNSPYALISAFFGVGPALVAFDSVMKLGRLTTAGARTVAEIALSRQSRHLAEGRVQAALKTYGVVAVICVGGAAVPALAVFLDAQRVFDLLLGPNNVLTADQGAAAAAILLLLGLYQPASLLLGYAEAPKQIRQATLIAFTGLIPFALAIRAGGDETRILWLYAAYLSLTAVAATLLMLQFLKSGASRPPAAETQ